MQFHGVRVYRATTQAISSSTETAISFSNEDYDTDGYWAIGSPTLLTVPSGWAGYYHIFGAVQFAGGTGYRLVFARLNGTTDILVPVSGSDTGIDPHLVFSTVRLLAEGDDLECIVYQNSGTSKNIENGSETGNYVPSFGMHLVGTP